MSSDASRRGLLIILSSPSGAGKSTLSGRLRDWDPTIRFSVSATTRAPRPGEEDGREYHFRSETEFKRMVADGEMLEHAHVFGNHYGSPLPPVKTASRLGMVAPFCLSTIMGSLTEMLSLESVALMTMVFMGADKSPIEAG